MAKKIVQTSRKIVSEEGFPALTFELIAERAGVNKAATRYYFGSKDGLLAAMLDDLVRTEFATSIPLSSESASLDERIDRIIDFMTELLDEADAYRTFFEMLPLSLRRDDLRDHLITLYCHWTALFVDMIGANSDRSAEEVKAISQVLVALIDGLWIQNQVFREPGANREMAPILKSMLKQFFLPSRETHS